MGGVARVCLLVSLLATAGCVGVPQRGVPQRGVPALTSTPMPASAPAPAPTLSGDAAHPGSTAGWVRTELYFGLGTSASADSSGTEAGINATTWQAFLDAEVTPRFPTGLTVLDAFGQWQGKEQKQPERLRSKVIVLLYPDSPSARASIDAIRAAWKTKTGDQSVLRVTQPADVSF